MRARASRPWKHHVSTVTRGQHRRLRTCLLPQNEPEHATALDGGRGKVCTHPSELPAVRDPLSSSLYTAQNISPTQSHLPPSKHPKGAACSHVGRITPYKLIPLILSPSHPSEDYTFRESHRDPRNHHHQSKKRSSSKSLKKKTQ